MRAEPQEEISQKDEAEHPIDDEDDSVDGGTERGDGHDILVLPHLR